jgi:YegS/Rv2252/BmrU family lipid kinase
MPVEPLRILFVINRNSGRKKRIDWQLEIKEFFKDSTHTISIFEMPYANAAEALHYSVVEFKPQRVVAVGGDGTVNFVVKELLGSEIPLAILPAGSANGMAKELRIPVSAREAIENVLSGEIKNTDVIRIDEKNVCLHLSDIGLNAQLIKYFEEGKVRGILGYGLALLKTLYRKHQIKVAVQTKDQEVLKSALMVIIANASKYGTGAQINPEGNLHDGFFEVVIVRRIGLREILKMFFKFKRFDPKRIEVLSAKSVTLETPRRVHFQVDGEYLGKINQVSASILPGQLKLIIPKK